jgi:hypothetical protein
LLFSVWGVRWDVPKALISERLMPAEDLGERVCFI